MRCRGVSSAIAAALALSAALALTACASGPTRTQPNDVERAALAAAASSAAAGSGSHSALQLGGQPDPQAWRQLWTPTQADLQIQSCVARQTNGLIQAQVDVGPEGLGISVSYGVGAGTGGDAAGSLTRENVQRAIALCVTDTPIDDRVYRVPRERWAALYSYDVTVLRRCLLSHGYPVDSAPSRARFERLVTAGTPWSPYDQVIVANRAAWYAVSDACPAIPKVLAVG